MGSVGRTAEQMTEASPHCARHYHTQGATSAVMTHCFCEGDACNGHFRTDLVEEEEMK